MGEESSPVEEREATSVAPPLETRTLTKARTDRCSHCSMIHLDSVDLNLNLMTLKRDTKWIRQSE